MKLSLVLASALGLAFVESGMALNAEEERKSPPVRFAYSDAPYERVQPIMKIHRPKTSRAAYHYAKKSRHYNKKKRRSSGVRYRGAKRAFPSRISPPGVRLFIFSPRKRAWAAYLPNGRLVGYGRASGGASWCRDIGRSCRTPRGTYRIYSKGSAGCRSSRYPKPRGGAPMPYCMFFSKYYAIHGSPDVPNRNASHGCIRVKPRAARWLSHNFITIGTRVVITSY